MMTGYPRQRACVAHRETIRPLRTLRGSHPRGVRAAAEKSGPKIRRGVVMEAAAYRFNSRPTSVETPSPARSDPGTIERLSRGTVHRCPATSLAGPLVGDR